MVKHIQKMCPMKVLSQTDSYLMLVLVCLRMLNTLESACRFFFSSSIWKHLLACSDLHISFLQGVSVRNLGLQCQNSQPCCIIGLSFPGCTTSLREFCVSQAGCNAARAFQSTIQNEVQKSKLCSHFSIIKWSSISFVVVLAFLATVLARILGLKQPQKYISMVWKLIFWFWEIKSNQDWSWFNLHMI